jgi:hypothetical protein
MSAQENDTRYDTETFTADQRFPINNIPVHLNFDRGSSDEEKLKDADMVPSDLQKGQRVTRNYRRAFVPMKTAQGLTRPAPFLFSAKIPENFFQPGSIICIGLVTPKHSGFMFYQQAESELGCSVYNDGQHTHTRLGVRTLRTTINLSETRALPKDDFDISFGFLHNHFFALLPGSNEYETTFPKPGEDIFNYDYTSDWINNCQLSLTLSSLQNFQDPEVSCKTFKRNILKPDYTDITDEPTFEQAPHFVIQDEFTPTWAKKTQESPKESTIALEGEKTQESPKESTIALEGEKPQESPKESTIALEGDTLRPDFYKGDEFLQVVTCDGTNGKYHSESKWTLSDSNIYNFSKNRNMFVPATRATICAPRCFFSAHQPNYVNFNIKFTQKAIPEFIAVGLILKKHYHRNPKYDKDPVSPPNYAFSPGNSENSADSIGFHSDDGSIIVATQAGDKTLCSLDKYKWFDDKELYKQELNIGIGFDGDSIYVVLPEEDGVRKRLSPFMDTPPSWKEDKGSFVPILQLEDWPLLDDLQAKLSNLPKQELFDLFNENNYLEREEFIAALAKRQIEDSGRVFDWYAVRGKLDLDTFRKILAGEAPKVDKGVEITIKTDIPSKVTKPDINFSLLAPNAIHKPSLRRAVVAVNQNAGGLVDALDGLIDEKKDCMNELDKIHFKENKLQIDIQAQEKKIEQHTAKLDAAERQFDSVNNRIIDIEATLPEIERRLNNLGDDGKRYVDIHMEHLRDWTDRREKERQEKEAIKQKEEEAKQTAAQENENEKQLLIPLVTAARLPKLWRYDYAGELHFKFAELGGKAHKKGFHLRCGWVGQRGFPRQTIRGATFETQRAQILAAALVSFSSDECIFACLSTATRSAGRTNPQSVEKIRNFFRNPPIEFETNNPNWRNEEFEITPIFSDPLTYNHFTNWIIKPYKIQDRPAERPLGTCAMTFTSLQKDDFPVFNFGGRCVKKSVQEWVIRYREAARAQNWEVLSDAESDAEEEEEEEEGEKGGGGGVPIFKPEYKIQLRF